MSNFIKSIGNCYVNSIGFDLYENKSGTATIRPIKAHGIDFPKRDWINFDSLDEAEEFIEKVAGDSTGAEKVSKLKEWFFSEEQI